MKKVITYGTYDLLHYGHIRLLERAKALGDYLIVGVTSDGFDKARGKINVQQSLMERIDAVKATGLADQIVIEEYEGQKIDDIKKYHVDIFTVGSDWIGKFDYLNEYCEVVYLDRTQGVSSTELRCEKRKERIGLIGGSPNAMAMLEKFERESHYANGVEISGLCTTNKELPVNLRNLPLNTDNIDDLLAVSDALYIISQPQHHYEQIKKALLNHKHVLCESPIVTKVEQWEKLNQLAKDNKCVLMDGIKTAYSTAYNRMLVIAKSGRIGDIVSIDATCTSIYNVNPSDIKNVWNSISAWGPTAMLPIFQLLGTEYNYKRMASMTFDSESGFDQFTCINFEYPHAVASLKVGQGVKSEGQLLISGTKGYIYVPAPWWKTDYFEIRYENQTDNKRYFYKLEGEGIRNEIVSFLRAIQGNYENTIYDLISRQIVQLIEDFYLKKYSQIK